MKLLRHRALFTLVLLLFVAGMLWKTSELGRVARFVPLLVMAPTLALLAFQVALDVFPRLRGISRGLEAVRWLPPPAKPEAMPAAMPVTMPAATAATIPGTLPQEERAVGAAAKQGATARFLWTLALPGMVYLLGFSVAVPLHALVYLRGLSGERWRLALAVAAGLAVLAWLVARLVAAVSLWPGWVWMRVGLI